jgi:hypothetical protein
VRIRMLYEVTGTFHGIEGGIPRGGVVDIDDVHAQRYIAAGAAKRAENEPAAVEEESAVIEPETESAVVKPRRGRPKKQPEWHDDGPGWQKADDD